MLAHTLQINDATILDDVGSRILGNIRRTFEAFPHFAILELGECARALADPLLNNAVIPLKVQMNPCRGSTVLRRPAFAGEPKTHTVTEFVSTNVGPREAFKDIVKDILQVGAWVGAWVLLLLCVCVMCECNVLQGMTR